MGNLDGVRQAVAEVIGDSGCEDLRFILQPSKCARVHHSIAVALKFVSERMGKFRIAAAAAVLHGKAEMRQRRIQLVLIGQIAKRESPLDFGIARERACSRTGKVGNNAIKLAIERKLAGIGRQCSQ